MRSTKKRIKATQGHKSKLIISLLLGLVVFFPHPKQAHAEKRIESTNYKIIWPNINMGSGKPTSDNYDLNITMGQIAPGPFSSVGYKIRSGFQYIHWGEGFQFSVSTLAIDLGNLTPLKPSLKTNTLNVRCGNAAGYQVTAQENHPLASKSGSTISDTTCNNGKCTESLSSTWTRNTTYGFGFNIIGDDIPADFIDKTNYRQFADGSKRENPQVLMSKNSVCKSRTAKVTYKANVSNTQSAGIYQNIITYIAIPRY